MCLKGHKLNPLLWEQVVGRGLRRASYEVGADGLLTEVVAKVFGVPFQIVPFKTNPAGSTPPPIKRHHVRALPERKALEIRFPRVEGYTQQVRNRIRVDWETVPGIVIEPGKIPPEVEVKALHSTNTGRLSLHGPGRIDKVELTEFRARRRLQELVFDVAGALTRQYREQNRCEIPANALFPQMAAVVDRYVRKKVRVLPPADLLDLFLAPYYGWLVEALRENIRGDETRGESPELPLLEPHRGSGTTGEVDFWTSREVRQVVKRIRYGIFRTFLRKVWGGLGKLTQPKAGETDE